MPSAAKASMPAGDLRSCFDTTSDSLTREQRTLTDVGQNCTEPTAYLVPRRCRRACHYASQHAPGCGSSLGSFHILQRLAQEHVWHHLAEPLQSCQFSRAAHIAGRHIASSFTLCPCPDHQAAAAPTWSLSPHMVG